MGMDFLRGGGLTKPFRFTVYDLIKITKKIVYTLVFVFLLHLAFIEFGIRTISDISH